MPRREDVADRGSGDATEWGTPLKAQLEEMQKRFPVNAF